MSIPVYVDAYSGYRANERPMRFHLDRCVFDIVAIENSWRDLNAEYFKVRTLDGKRYLLRHSEKEEEWTLRSDFDGDELLKRPNLQLVVVDPATIRQAEELIGSCVRCDPDEPDRPFNILIAHHRHARRL